MAAAEMAQLVTMITEIISSIAIITGGIWVYIKYIRNGEGTWSLQLSMNSETFQISESARLLQIRVTLNNISNIKVTPGSEGMLLTVRKINCEGLTDISADLDGGDIVSSKDMLRRYWRTGSGYSRYVIAPNCEYHEIECIKVSKGDILSARAEFFWKDGKDSITEYMVVQIQ